jgi:hypothetical protein
MLEHDPENLQALPTRPCDRTAAESEIIIQSAAISLERFSVFSQCENRCKGSPGPLNTNSMALMRPCNMYFHAP